VKKSSELRFNKKDTQKRIDSLEKEKCVAVLSLYWKIFSTSETSFIMIMEDYIV
jgi:hypothetical protein